MQTLPVPGVLSGPPSDRFGEVIADQPEAEGSAFAAILSAATHVHTAEAMTSTSQIAAPLLASTDGKVPSGHQGGSDVDSPPDRRSDSERLIESAIEAGTWAFNLLSGLVANIGPRPPEAHLQVQLDAAQTESLESDSVNETLLQRSQAPDNIASTTIETMPRLTQNVTVADSRSGNPATPGQLPSVLPEDLGTTPKPTANVVQPVSDSIRHPSAVTGPSSIAVPVVHATPMFANNRITVPAGAADLVGSALPLESDSEHWTSFVSPPVLAAREATSTLDASTLSDTPRVLVFSRNADDSVGSPVQLAMTPTIAISEGAVAPTTGQEESVLHLSPVHITGAIDLTVGQAGSSRSQVSHFVDISTQTQPVALTSDVEPAPSTSGEQDGSLLLPADADEFSVTHGAPLDQVDRTLILPVAAEASNDFASVSHPPVEGADVRPSVAPASLRDGDSSGQQPPQGRPSESEDHDRIRPHITTRDTDNIIAQPGAVLSVTPTTASPTQEAAQPLRHPVIAQIASGLHQASEQVGQLIELRLQPEGLGSVSLEVGMNGSEVHVRIAVDNPTTRDLIQSNWQSLTRSLQEQGVTISGSQVELLGGQAQWSGEGDRHTPLAPQRLTSRLNAEGPDEPVSNVLAGGPKSTRVDYRV